MKNILTILIVLITLSACFNGVKDWNGSYSDLTDAGKQCIGAWLGYKDAAFNMSHAVKGLNINVNKILILKLGLSNKSNYSFIALLSSSDKVYLLYNNPYSKKANMNEINGSILQEIEPLLANLTRLNNKFVQGQVHNISNIPCQFYLYNDGENITRTAFIGHFEKNIELKSLLYKLRSKYLDKDSPYQPLSDLTDEDLGMYEQKLKEDLFFEIQHLKVE